MNTLIVINDAPYGTERAYGITADHLAEGARRGSLDQWAQWTIEADKVVVF